MAVTTEERGWMEIEGGSYAEVRAAMVLQLRKVRWSRLRPHKLAARTTPELRDYDNWTGDWSACLAYLDDWAARQTAIMAERTASSPSDLPLWEFHRSGQVASLRCQTGEYLPDEGAWLNLAMAFCGIARLGPWRWRIVADLEDTWRRQDEEWSAEPREGELADELARLPTRGPLAPVHDALARWRRPSADWFAGDLTACVGYLDQRLEDAEREFAALATSHGVRHWAEPMLSPGLDDESVMVELQLGWSYHRWYAYWDVVRHRVVRTGTGFAVNTEYRATPREAEALWFCHDVPGVRPLSSGVAVTAWAHDWDELAPSVAVWLEWLDDPAWWALPAVDRRRARDHREYACEDTIGRGDRAQCLSALASWAAESQRVAAAEGCGPERRRLGAMLESTELSIGLAQVDVAEDGAFGMVSWHHADIRRRTSTSFEWELPLPEARSCSPDHAADAEDD